MKPWDHFVLALISAFLVYLEGMVFFAGDKVGGVILGGLNLLCWALWVYRLHQARKPRAPGLDG